VVERAARKRSVAAVLGVVERQGSTVLASDLAGVPDVLVPDGQAAQSLDALAEIAREVPVEHLGVDGLDYNGSRHRVGELVQLDPGGGEVPVNRAQSEDQERRSEYYEEAGMEKEFTVE
jgi:hypothetical protein